MNNPFIDVFCPHCGEFVNPIYEGDCPNCGEYIGSDDNEEWDDESDEDEEWDDEGDEDDNMSIGYIVKKNQILSQMGTLYIEEIKNYFRRHGLSD